jgi:antitoxin VapB
VGLNIKNAETERLIRELAAIEGESLTDAVTLAVRERLERLKHEQGRDGRLARMKAIAEEIAAGLQEPYKSMDHGDLLYDDVGLPK